MPGLLGSRHLDHILDLWPHQNKTLSWNHTMVHLNCSCYGRKHSINKIVSFLSWIVNEMTPLTYDTVNWNCWSVYISHGGNRNKQGGHVTLMWLVALSRGLAVLWCGHAVLWRNPSWNQKKKACWSECECLWGCWSAWRAGWKVNGVPWPKYSRKLIIWHSRPHPFSY